MGLLAFTGCEKGDAPENIDPQNILPSGEGSLVGAWELRMTYGGFHLPNTSPVHGPGNGRIWQFTNNSYVLYAKEKVLTSGIYTRTRDVSPATGTVMDAIVMPGNGGLKIHYGFLKDTLVLYQGTIAADGTIEKYVRVPPPAGTSK